MKLVCNSFLFGDARRWAPLPPAIHLLIYPTRHTNALHYFYVINTTIANTLHNPRRNVNALSPLQIAPHCHEKETTVTTNQKHRPP